MFNIQYGVIKIDNHNPFNSKFYDLVLKNWLFFVDIFNCLTMNDILKKNWDTLTFASILYHFP